MFVVFVLKPLCAPGLDDIENQGDALLVKIIRRTVMLGRTISPLRLLIIFWVCRCATPMPLIRQIFQLPYLFGDVVAARYG
jgi:hypothetical protein